MRRAWDLYAEAHRAGRALQEKEEKEEYEVGTMVGSDECYAG